MSGVFRYIYPPSPHRPASVYFPASGAGGGHTRWVERVWGVNSSEDARHCSVLYICKYFVQLTKNRPLMVLNRGEQVPPDRLGVNVSVDEDALHVSD